MMAWKVCYGCKKSYQRHQRCRGLYNGLVEATTAMELLCTKVVQAKQSQAENAFGCKVSVTVCYRNFIHPRNVQLVVVAPD